MDAIFRIRVIGGKSGVASLCIVPDNTGPSNGDLPWEKCKYDKYDVFILETFKKDIAKGIWGKPQFSIIHAEALEDICCRQASRHKMAIYPTSGKKDLLPRREICTL